MANGQPSRGVARRNARKRIDNKHLPAIDQKVLPDFAEAWLLNPALRRAWAANVAESDRRAGAEQRIRETYFAPGEPAWLEKTKRLYARFGRLLSVVSHHDHTAEGVTPEIRADAEHQLRQITDAVEKTAGQGLATSELVAFLRLVDAVAKRPTRDPTSSDVLPALTTAGSRALLKPWLTKTEVDTWSPFNQLVRAVLFRYGMDKAAALEMRARDVANLLRQWPKTKADTRPSKYDLAARLFNEIGGPAPRGRPWTEGSVKQAWLSAGKGSRRKKAGP